MGNAQSSQPSFNYEKQLLENRDEIQSTEVGEPQKDGGMQYLA